MHMHGHNRGLEVQSGLSILSFLLLVKSMVEGTFRFGTQKKMKYRLEVAVCTQLISLKV
jgi:hypothetical protein